MFRDVLQRFRRLASKPLSIFVLNYRVVIRNVYVGCSQRPQTTLEVQHTEWCIKDISLLYSNEDNPRFTDSVCKVCYYQLSTKFSLGTYKNNRAIAQATS